MAARRTRMAGAIVILIAGALVPALSIALSLSVQAQYVQPAQPPPGMARVWFLRQFEPAENLSTPWIFVNGSPMTTSQPGTIFYRDFPPGTYTFSVETCGRDVNQFPVVQLVPGIQAEFEVQSLQSFTPPDCPRGAGTFYLRPVSPRFLQLYLPQLANLGPR